MLDENLPTFYTKPSSSDNPLASTIFLGQNGSELQPEYTLRRPDPNLAASKNCYAIALYDSYNPEILYAEVLVRPQWTQPTLSQAEIRAQNGIPPPPVPIVPNNFTIQLYNPDQQVTVRQIAKSWNSSTHWEFEMPQNSFRLPSASALDRSQNDPATSDLTPKITFKWKRDGKLTKDISCYLVGKSTDSRKTKEPDITVAMYRGGKALTIYEPNMHRVEVEDVKGLEVVFLLSAAVIKDIFFNANRETFNISSPTTVGANAKRKNSGPVISTGRASVPPPVMSGAVLSSPATNTSPQLSSRPQQQQSAGPSTSSPQTQWEIDAETARLKALVEAEEKERERAEIEEQKRIERMLKAEEEERRRREAEVAKETERLRKQYGVTGGLDTTTPSNQFSSAPPPMPPRPQDPWLAPPAAGFPQYQSAPHSVPDPVQRPLSTPTGPRPSHATSHRPHAGSSPYLQAPGNGTASSSGFFSLAGKKLSKKKSVFF
ncbi:hypothetical protein M430DRAFT_124885 [Amorphotheca resinae ATCC 22711]|jgi:hypothetical protein|uniref:Uncharacterized protein n=1 Tax=Amorphotheca resinae ATCC 22711 TaxID=857342 RepID=A0A2T3AWK0_AMORE|nr:hypothetical protein M430DRAFT_124885 [Amorphotheca resinae ATCC 22711]PSS13033.1 hypothetical protein M430DRAFT_124885 [Amorphotheca resinae ATCC 22711]